MAKIYLVGLEQAVAGRICRVLAADNHRVEQQSQGLLPQEILDAEMVFAGGGPACYLSLLRRIREVRPTLPFIVVTRTPETKDWIDALKAGATDYCSEPIETRQFHWLMESALSRHRVGAA